MGMGNVMLCMKPHHGCFHGSPCFPSSVLCCHGCSSRPPKPPVARRVTHNVLYRKAEVVGMRIMRVCRELELKQEGAEQLNGSCQSWFAFVLLGSRFFMTLVFAASSSPSAMSLPNVLMVCVAS